MITTNQPIFYVYIDFRADTCEPFYVGKGSLSRAITQKRNARHTRIAEKHGMNRDIVLATHDEQFAWDHESMLITELKTRNTFGGANFTDGGEGARGRKHRPESIAKMRGRRLTEEHKKKLSIAKQGNQANKGRKFSAEHRKKISEAHRGKRLTEEHKRKIGDINRTKRRTPEMRERISNGSKGRKLSEETRRKIAETVKRHHAERKANEAGVNHVRQEIMEPDV